MKVIGCYSYKGGTGRSTSVANLGAALAVLGKNVLLLDLDIEGPGLSVILGQQDRDEVAIQDYLMSTDPLNFDYRRMVIDLKESAGAEEVGQRWAAVPGHSYFIPARIGVERSTIVEYKEDRIQRLLGYLFDRIATDTDLRLDYVLLDAASGYGEMSAVSIALSDLLLVFLRWSRQHLYGTVKIAQFLKYLVEGRNLDIDYEFVANCVPEVDSGDRAEFLDEIRTYLEECIEQPLFCTLPENTEMKWDERLIVLEDDPESADLIAAFKDFARKTVQHFEGS